MGCHSVNASGCNFRRGRGSASLAKLLTMIVLVAAAILLVNKHQQLLNIFTFLWIYQTFKERSFVYK